MSYSNTISVQQFALTIVDDSEERIKQQDVIITIFDNHLFMKFKKHRNKKLKYCSIYRWIMNKDYTKIRIEYESRKNKNIRSLIFLSEDGLAKELRNQLLDHCQFIADVKKERKK